MTPAPARLGLLFALTLAVPAAFTVAWAWLLHGGVVARALATERQASEQALATAARALDAELHSTAAQLDLVLLLAEERRVVAPFAAVPTTSVSTRVPSIAEQAAGSQLAAGDIAAALPFFAHAAADGSLSPEGWLRYADLHARTDRHSADHLLDQALQQHHATFCGPVPFALLAELRRAAWADAATTDREPAMQRLLREVPRVPAAAVEAVAAELIAAIPAFAHDAPLRHLRAAATAALHLRGGPAPDTLSLGPDGSVLVPLADSRLGVVPSVEVKECRARAIAAAARAEPSVQVLATPTLVADAPGRAMPVLAEHWMAPPIATPTSTLLTFAAHASLTLAILTLVVGNLLLWRLTRRELALVRLRADFVDIVSHELRTPLTALSLKSEMLALGDVPAARVPHYLLALHGDVRRLADQVERILDFGRLQKGAALRRDVLPARAVLARGLRAGRAALRLVAQQLTVEVPRSLPTVRGDVDVLSRALRNLLENAAKYAPPGSTVAVRAFADNHELVIEIADRGPGVPPVERRGIFQPFVRGSTATASTPGSGLGLALVAAAAKVHDGSVEVRQRDGGGSVFTLRLPLHGEAAS